MRGPADAFRRRVLWTGLFAIAAAPVAMAALSPLLPGREFLWIVGGMAGVVMLSLLFVQPVLTAAAPTLLAWRDGIRWHRWTGLTITAMAALHVAALYLYSPDDVTDVLLLAAPTPFSIYGVISLWCLVLTIILVATRRWLRLADRRWRVLHSVLAVAIVAAGAVHAVMIEGAMEDISKLLICCAALATTTAGALEINIFRPLRQRVSSRA